MLVDRVHLVAETICNANEHVFDVACKGVEAGCLFVRIEVHNELDSSMLFSGKFICIVDSRNVALNVLVGFREFASGTFNSVYAAFGGKFHFLFDYLLLEFGLVLS